MGFDFHLLPLDKTAKRQALCPFTGSCSRCTGQVERMLVDSAASMEGR